MEINPLIAAPYRALAESGTGSGHKEQAIAAYRRLLLLGPADPAETYFQLARLLHERGGAESEAKRQVLRALEDPVLSRRATIVARNRSRFRQRKKSGPTSNLIQQNEHTHHLACSRNRSAEP